MRIAPLLTAGVLILAASNAVGQQVDPTALPARESHEGFMVAADAYADQSRSKERFGKRTPFEAGVLALEVYFRNDTDKAIKVDVERIRLLLAVPGEERQRLRPMPLEDVVNLMVYKKGPDPTSPRRPLPRPFPEVRGGAAKDKDVRQVNDVLQPLALATDVVPPRGTIHGMLFFNLDHRFELLRHAQLDVPDLKFMQDGKSLLFFEVDLGPAAKP